jgi:hypothetical protein
MLTAKCNTVLDVCAHLSSMSLARTEGREAGRQGWGSSSERCACGTTPTLDPSPQGGGRRRRREFRVRIDQGWGAPRGATPEVCR